MKKLTVAKAHNILSHYLTSLGYKEKTIKTYVRKINRFFNYLTGIEGIHDIRDVNEAVLNRFLTWLNETVSEKMQQVLAASTKREIYLSSNYYSGVFMWVSLSW